MATVFLDERWKHFVREMNGRVYEPGSGPWSGCLIVNVCSRTIGSAVLIWILAGLSSGRASQWLVHLGQNMIKRSRHPLPSSSL